ncbi:MAG: DUF3426 domain-containing protein [Burkholderiaceae bacterium]
MSLVTRCPACSTLFKVVPDQIRIAAGWVRCGHCGEVFDASAHLLPRGAAAPPAPVNAPVVPATPPVAQPPSAPTPLARAADPVPPAPAVESATGLPQAGHRSASPGHEHGHEPEPSLAAAQAAPPSPVTPDTAPTPGAPESRSTDMDELRSTGVSLPPYLRPAEPAQASPAGALDTGPSALAPLEGADAELGGLQPIDLRLADAGATEPMLLDPLDPLAPAGPRSAFPRPDDAPLDDAPLEAPPSFVAAARRRAFWSTRPVRAVLWLGATLGVLALAGQWAVGQRDWLAARAPQWAPALRALCAPLGCQIQPYRQLDAIVIDSSAFNRVAGPEFRFSVSLRNAADWPVANPALELTLTDRDNQPLVRRVLTPADLGAPPALAARSDFSTSQSVTVGAPVDAAAVAGYRLTAFYP